MNTKTQLISKLKNKPYRDAFVATYIDQGIPFQLRALREQRDWSQEKLASEAGMKQETISRLENPNNKSFTLKTLKQLAVGFDVGLIVRFVPISSIVEWVHNLPTSSLEVLSFDQEPYFQEGVEEEIEQGLDQSSSITTKASEIDPEKLTTDLIEEEMLHGIFVYDYTGKMISIASDKIQPLIP